jgi:fluoride exporter
VQPQPKTREDEPIVTPRTLRTNALEPGIDRPELLAIACGGALGALARVGLAQAFSTSAGSWPWATFAVNMVGAVMIGYFVTRLQERLPVSTTFSTVQIELLRMIDQHRMGLATAYLMVSLIGGYLAVFVSSAAVRRVRTIA